MTNNRNRFTMIVMILVVGFMAISCDTGFGMMEEELNLDGVWRNNWAIANNEGFTEWSLTFQGDIAIFELRATRNNSNHWDIYTYQFHINGNQITFIPTFIDSDVHVGPIRGRYREWYTINTTFRMEDRGNTFHLMPWEGHEDLIVLSRFFRGRFERVR